MGDTNLDLISNIEDPTIKELNEFESEYFLGDKDYTRSTKYAGTPFMYTDEVEQYYPMLSPEEVEAVVKKRDAALPGSEEYYMYRNQLVEANLKLVVSWAYRYTRDHAIVTDYIQAGNMGLMVAADKYQLEKQCRFSTYASWWIRQAIIRHISLDHTMHVPVHIADKSAKITRFVGTFLQEHGREPMYNEISKATGIPESQIHLIRTSLNFDSLDRPVDEDETRTSPLGDFVPSDVNVEEEAIQHMTNAKLLDALKSFLNEREYIVLSLRYGLEDGQIRTLEDVGSRLGVTRERIRQIEAKAIRKLQVNPKFCRAFTLNDKTRRFQNHTA